MSKESTTNAALKNTTPDASSTSTTTSTEAKTEATTQAKDSASSTPTGIIEEGTSTEPPVEEAAVEPPKTEEPAATDIEPYELELSEESPLSDEEFDEVVAEAERLKLSKTDAEKLIALRESSHKASHQIFEKAAEERTKNMVTAYKGEASLHTIEAKLSMRESIKAFGNTPEFKEMFKDPSMNFNIPLAKFLISVGDKIRGGSNNLPAVKKSASVLGEGNADTNKAANNFYKDM